MSFDRLKEVINCTVYALYTLSFVVKLDQEIVQKYIIYAYLNIIFVRKNIFTVMAN